VEGVADIYIAENKKAKFGIEYFSEKLFHPCIETAGHCSLPYLWFPCVFCFLQMKVRRLVNCFVWGLHRAVMEKMHNWLKCTSVTFLPQVQLFVI